jgi:hypothetical protein
VDLTFDMRSLIENAPIQAQLNAELAGCGSLTRIVTFPSQREMDEHSRLFQTQGTGPRLGGQLDP